jgi:hypothetical protein
MGVAGGARRPLSEQFVEEPPKQVVALAFRGIGDPFRNALNALPALAVARVSKQQVVQPAENCGEFGVGVYARFAVHAMAADEFVAVVTATVVDVEHAPGYPVPRLDARARPRTAHDFSHSHYAVQVVVHFEDEERRAVRGGGNVDVGGRTINAPRVIVPATPVHVFGPRGVIEPGARYFERHFNLNVM